MRSNKTLTRKAFKSWLESLGNESCGEERICPVAKYLEFGEYNNARVFDQYKSRKWAYDFMVRIDHEYCFAWDKITGNQALEILNEGS